MTCPVLSALTTLAQIHEPMFIGCSGGRDSLSLAFGCHLLHQQGVLKRQPTLIHINHGIQHANDAWADFVKTWSNQHDFVCHVITLGLGQANETQAREARYRAIATLMQDTDVLLTAHHKDDQAETVLMRLINGAGVQGLSGMRVWQSRMVDGKTINIHRPLLGISRQDITDFAHRHHLPYVDDPTNDTTDNARSFIRHDILPRLATLNPKVSNNIAKVATLMAQAHSLTHEAMFEAFRRVIGMTPHTPFVSLLDTTKLMNLSAPMQSMVVRHWVQEGEALPPSTQLTDDIIALAHRTDTDHQTQLFWQSGDHGLIICRYQHTLYRYPHELFLLLHAPVDNSFITPQSDQVILKQQGRWTLAWHYHQFWQDLFANHLVCITPIGKTTLSVAVTYQDKQGHLKQGFERLSGKKLHQKLKIPTWQRQNLWGVSVDGELVLMMGVDEWWLLQSRWFDTLSTMRQSLGQSLCVIDGDECFAQKDKLM